MKNFVNPLFGAGIIFGMTQHIIYKTDFIEFIGGHCFAYIHRIKVTKIFDVLVEVRVGTGGVAVILLSLFMKLLGGRLNAFYGLFASAQTGEKVDTKSRSTCFKRSKALCTVAILVIKAISFVKLLPPDDTNIDAIRTEKTANFPRVVSFANILDRNLLDSNAKLLGFCPGFDRILLELASFLLGDRDYDLVISDSRFAAFLLSINNSLEIDWLDERFCDS